MTNSQLAPQRQTQTFFRYLHFIAMIFVTIILCDSVSVYKLVKMPFGYTSACAYVVPFWFITSDIIAEIYGKKIAKNILWGALVCSAIFSGACYVLIHLHSPIFWHEQHSFYLILGHLPRITLSDFIAIIISGYINIFFISKWKLLLNGRYFGLRSVGASLIGEFFYTIIAIVVMMYNLIDLRGMLEIILWSYLIKVLSTIVFSLPANCVVNLLKRIENTSTTSDNVPFNPFIKKLATEQTLNNKRILFLGGGNMTKTIVNGLITCGYNPQLIYVIDRNENKRQYFSQTLRTNVGTQAESFIPQVDSLFLAIKPQGAQESCQRLKPCLEQHNLLVVSVMAGITLQHLSTWMGNHLSIIRAMPNIPSAVRLGATGLYANSNTTIIQKKIIEQYMHAIGITGWMTEESQLDMITALSGSGPAYYFYFIEIMQNIAIKNGVPEAIAKAFAVQTAYGAGALASNNLYDGVTTLRQSVTSKNGTTAAAIQVLQNSHLASILEDALIAAKNRSHELSIIASK